MNLEAIVLEDERPELTVHWDMGRRCTYDCSYCGSHHHNNYSPFVDLEKLQCVLDNVVEYGEVLNQFRKEPIVTTISFTGGEPTAHPDFFDFVEWARDKYPDIRMCLTTNGCYNLSKAKIIAEKLNNITISYHADATDKQKELVVNNIKHYKKIGFKFKINLMMHKEYWDECMDLLNWFDKDSIRYVPRMIGDGSKNPIMLASGQAHDYTDEQLDFFSNYWKSKDNLFACKVNNTGSTNKSPGRPCCRLSTMNMKVDGEWRNTKVSPTTNFQGWNCAVNMYFLFVNLELDLWNFSQSCEVNINSQIGKMGRATRINEYTEKLREYLKKGEMPTIKCPKPVCSCGVCASKAKDDSDFRKIVEERWNYKPLIPDAPANTHKYAQREIYNWLDNRIEAKNID